MGHGRKGIAIHPGFSHDEVLVISHGTKGRLKNMREIERRIVETSLFKMLLGCRKIIKSIVHG
jgi:hypothetical protein